MSRMSRKCTVSADRSSARPSVKHQLHEHDDRKPEQVRAGRAGADSRSGTPTRIGRPRKKCTMFASTLTIGSTSAGNSTFLIRLPPAISDAGRLEQRRREPGPRQDAAEHEQRVGLELRRCVPGMHDGEDERVDQQQQQRVDERPEEAEHRAAVARLQLARDQALDEAAVAEQVGEVGEHRRTQLPAADSYAACAPAATCRRMQRLAAARCARARSPCRAARLASRSSARVLPASARATSMSSARSAICARIVTRSGCTSAKPNAIDQVVLLLPCRYHSSPALQRREQRRVAGQHAEVAVGAGISTSSTARSTSDRSGETICERAACVGRAMAQSSPAYAASSLLGASRRTSSIVPDQVELLLRHRVVLAFDDFLEAADRVGDRHVLAFEAGELLRRRRTAATGTSGSCARATRSACRLPTARRCRESR